MSQPLYYTAKEVNKFISERRLQIPYRVDIHPGNTSKQTAKHNPEVGMNCQLYTGIVVEALGRRILDVPRSRELWTDEEHTRFVPSGEPLATGDIAFLTDNPDKDPRLFHVGVVLVAEDGITWLTHNATHHGTAVVERLEDAVAHPSYGTIAGIKRPIAEHPNGTDYRFLEEHGLSDLVQTA